MNKLKLSMNQLREEFLKDGADSIETDIFLAQAKVRIDIWNHFERYALQVWNTGRRRYGAQTICHQIRWHMEIERGESEFDINNNWIAYYARMFMYIYPEARKVEFFEVRKFKEKNNAIDSELNREVLDRRTNSIPKNIQHRDEDRAGSYLKAQQQGIFPGRDR